MSAPFTGEAPVEATAWLVGERIDTRAFERPDVLEAKPLTLRVGKEGLAVVYRYGAVVLFQTAPEEERDFLERLRPAIHGPFEEPESDAGVIRVEAAREEGVDPEGVLWLRDAGVDRLQIVADVLARSALVAHYESQLALVLERAEAVAEAMRRRGRTRLRARTLLRQLGEALVTEMRLVGRAEVSEKPERVWDRPDLDRLYVRLAEEYELEERDRAVTRKVELLSRTVATFLEMLQTRRGLHLEAAIVALILVEIVLLVYEMMFLVP